MLGSVGLLAFILFVVATVNEQRLISTKGVLFQHVEYRSFWLGLVFFGVIYSTFRIPHATGIVLGLILHELGHVAAYRMLGHREVVFRLLPMVANRPSSTSALRSDAEQAFVALMGAGLSIVPMVLIYAGGVLFEPQSGEALRLLTRAGGTIAALNALNLLPLWPLDGGHLLHLISRSLSKRAAPYALLASSAFATALATHVQSATLLFTCLLGALIFYRPEALEPKHPAMPQRTALLVALSWAFVLATHLAGGWWMLRWFLFETS